MAELDELRRAMHDSSELWQLGKSQKALKLLDDAIAVKMNLPTNSVVIHKVSPWPELIR